MRIVVAETASQIYEARQLFKEYAASLQFDLCFQNFEQELDGLPGDYGPPNGRLLLAVTDADAVAGCVALRQLLPRIGEMKRLYVRPTYRGLGLGKRLALAVLEAATNVGYKTVRLDTTPTMTEAIRMYETLGFIKIAPYRPNPIEGAIYMEIGLSKFKE